MTALRNYIGYRIPAIPGESEDERRIRLFLSIAEENGITPSEQERDNLAAEILEERKAIRRMDRLCSGAAQWITPEMEAAEWEECRLEADTEWKIREFLNAVIQQEMIQITRAEAEAEADAIAQRQGTTVEFVHRFFGEDLRGIVRELQREKAERLIVENAIFTE